MPKLTFKNLKLFGKLNNQSNTFIRTPEPAELCELDAVYILAEWLYYASLTNMVSPELCINLSTYLDAIPSTGK